MPVKKRTVKKTTSARNPRGAGRKPGEPNKDSKKHSLLEYARQVGKPPAEFLIDIANGIPFKDASGTEHKPTHAEMAQAARDVAPYCHPKLRSQEIKGEIIPGVLTIKNA